MVTMKSVPFLPFVLLLLLISPSGIDAYSSDPPGENGKDDIEQRLGSAWPFGWLATEENHLAPQREEALQKIQEVLGIRSQSENLASRNVPPQFMMELYNIIADSGGVTRGRNPYNAKIVRSFIERDSSLSRFYFFNISGLDANESVLQAELHLYRKKTPLKNLRPSTSPYYLIRVYQVLNERSLDTPSLHRLLNVRRVGAHASGWQVFNVKRAVLGWVRGEPNLGLLVTTSTLFEDDVAMEFSRRNDHRHGKQPILVLFDDDSNDRPTGRTFDVTDYYVYGNQHNEADDEKEEEELAYERDADGERNLENNYADSTERYRRRRRQRGQFEEVRLANRREPELFQRQKRERGGQDASSRYDVGALALQDETSGRQRRQRDVASKGRSARIVSGRDNTRIPTILTSMDIYARTAFRERLGQTVRDRSARSRPVARERRSTARVTAADERTNASQPNDDGTVQEECARHELYVDFRDIGLSTSIIAPAGYSAYQCKGACKPPLGQDQRPTNHATIQAIVHKMGLVKDVGRPCCVPTKLLSTSILFYDNENVVLKMYEDMVADRCGCR